MNTRSLRFALMIFVVVAVTAFVSFKSAPKRHNHGNHQHSGCGCSHAPAPQTAPANASSAAEQAVTPQQPVTPSQNVPTPRVVSNACGTVTVTEPVLLELLDSAVMERIKHVEQYGVMRYAQKDFYSFTRYDHSVGVFTLLRRFGAPLEEQIAGLLHDASHTVFSHVADHLFAVSSLDNPYQDDIHEWYLRQQKVPELLAKYGLSADILNPDQPHYRRLEQNLPDLCADRIQYNLAGGLLENMLTQKEVDDILNNLKFEDGTWFFTSTDAARKFSMVSHKLTEKLWGAEWVSCISRWAAHALKRATELGLVTFDDIHFSTDDKVWATLMASNDAIIQEALDKVQNYKAYYRMATPEKHDVHVRAKFSAVDPLVAHNKQLVRLTTLDATYAQQYENLKKQVRGGYYVTFIEPDYAPHQHHNGCCEHHNVVTA